MKRLVVLTSTAIFGATLALLPRPVAAEAETLKLKEGTAESPAATQDVSGADEFQRYCALCHGADGRGMGPLSDVDAMKKRAADLSQIALRNNGVFPFSKVANTISVGGSLAAHVPSRMMAWEKIFSVESDPVRAKAIIFEVTSYVERLQEK
jgi:cytochrome c5